MKEISSGQVEKAVYDIVLEANYQISPDIRQAVEKAAAEEETATGRSALGQILENYDIASRDEVAICQDSGMTVIFAQVGQDLHIAGGFVDAVNAGVRKAHTEGCLRASVVAEPLFERKNTKDNTPAVIHTELAPGDKLILTAVAKGFGSENTSRARMFVPANTREEIRDFVVETAAMAGPNACPPVIVGVGVGGTIDMAALLSKRATVRPVGQYHADPRYAALEREWLDAVNETGVGPAGFGGRTTALWLAIDTFPTHIASIPVVVNLCCHASRHASIEL